MRHRALPWGGVAVALCTSVCLYRVPQGWLSTGINQKVNDPFLTIRNQVMLEDIHHFEEHIYSITDNQDQYSSAAISLTYAWRSD